MRVRRRFDLYNRTEAATKEFSAWVEALAPGTVVCVSISDTAIAKTRPVEPPTYAALRLLGASRDMDVIGYRNPFVFIGAKGLPEGAACVLLDKRAQSKTVLRLDARVVPAPGGKGGGCPVELVDVKDSSISAKEGCPDREAQGYVFKNCQTHVVGPGGKLTIKR